MAKKKVSIQQAGAALADRGFQLIRGAGFNPGAKETSYEVRQPNGKTRTMTSSQILNLLGSRSKSGKKGTGTGTRGEA